MSIDTIPFNKPYKSKNEIQYIREVVESGLVSGDRKYTKLVQQYID